MASKEVFLSYGRETEVIYFVSRLKSDLEQAGFAVWLDSDDISSGSDWHGAIGTALDYCKAVIAVITNKYVASRFCKGELYTADSSKKLIFPIFLEEVDLSASELARGVKYIISGINWTFFRSGLDDYTVSLEKLVKGMKEQGLGGDVAGNAAGGEDSADVRDVTDHMSQLQVTPDRPHPSAPPPSASVSPLPYGYPPPPQPYYTTPSPNVYGPQITPPHVPYPPPGQYPPSPYQHPLYPGAYQPGPYHPAPYQAPPYPTSGPHQAYHPSGHFQTSPQYTTGNGHQAPPPGTHPPVQYTSPQYPPGAPSQHPPGSHYASPQPTNGTHLPVQYAPPPNEPPPPYELSEGTDGRATTSVVNRPNFKVGMKLEAVDQRFPYFVCVATVMDKSDEDEERILIHFDGWSIGYNYWCSRDDIELHPAGWCEKHGWELQAPHGISWNGWSAYLEATQSEKAPHELFNEAQLLGPCSLFFAPGMKVEAKDRVRRNQISVASITEVRPGEVKVHIDGHSEDYDYWCPSSSTDIHPCMWSGKQLRALVKPPPGYAQGFKWNIYLADPERRPAPAHIFNKAQRAGVETAGVQTAGVQTAGVQTAFQIGMRLEAKDRLNPTMVAIATVANIKDKQLLIHFDGWSSTFDYWCPPNCIDIHPMGWCEENGIHLCPPKESFYSTDFNWQCYLSSVDAIAAPKTLFTKAQVHVTSLSEDATAKVQSSATKTKFEVGMRLEAKDRKNPSLICAATIVDVKSKAKTSNLLIHFDGWSSAYNYWCKSNSTDIHPMGWSKKKKLSLQEPYGYTGYFEWNRYLESVDAVAAPSSLFTLTQRS